MKLAGNAGQRSGRGRSGLARARLRGARRRAGRGAAWSIRRVGVTLGLAGCALTGAAAAVAAGHQTGWTIVPAPDGSRSGDNTLNQVSTGGPQWRIVKTVRGTNLPQFQSIAVASTRNA